MLLKLINQTKYLPSEVKKSLRLPSFSHFPLLPSINKFLQSEEIETPSYVQYSLLSKIYQNPNKPHFYHIISPTGSGKTLAYMVPVINHLKNLQLQEAKVDGNQEKQDKETSTILTKSQRPQAIIFTATKQLTLQVRNVGKTMAHHCKIKCEGLGIGRSLSQQKQILNNGVDIIVSGTSRFSRMLDRKQAYLSSLRWIVIDEIDTIFQSQNKNLMKLLKDILVPKLQSNFNRSNTNINVILCSTTNPPQLQSALKSYFDGKGNLPQFQQIIDKKTHINLQNIKHQFIYCNNYDKHQPLFQQLKRCFKNINNVNCNKVMVFCNTVKSLHELQYQLQTSKFSKNIITLHSQLNKMQRLKNYEKFRDLPENQKGVLLATDLGARGLHFPNLNYILNYDFPMTTCDYLQRAGRTGRAGKKGFVVTLYHKKNLDVINQLKDASFQTPLKISNSAYGLKNREQTSKPMKFNRK